MNPKDTNSAEGSLDFDQGRLSPHLPGKQKIRARPHAFEGTSMR